MRKLSPVKIAAVAAIAVFVILLIGVFTALRMNSSFRYQQLYPGNSKLNPQQVLYLKFNKTIASIDVKKLNITPTADFTYGIVDNWLILYPQTELELGKKYTISAAGIRDQNGNEIQTRVTFDVSDNETAKLDTKPPLKFDSLNPALNSLPYAGGKYSLGFHLYEGKKVSVFVRLAAQINNTEYLNANDPYSAYLNDVKTQKKEALEKLKSLKLSPDKTVYNLPEAY